MSEDIESLSESQLSELIAKASRELETKRTSKKREITAQIKELASSVGLGVEISDPDKKSKRKGRSVPIKYRDATNPKNVWTGRGITPRWLKAYINQGRTVEEFRLEKSERVEKGE